MSLSNSTPLGSRANFWAGVETEYHESGHGTPLTGTSWVEYIGHTLLAEGATFLCRVCEDEHEEFVELDGPCEYPPLSQLVDDDGFHVELYGDHRRHRRCPERGHIVWGGHLQDRPEAKFMGIVDDVLNGIGDVPPSRHEELRTRARRRKQKGMHDTTNMGQVVTELRFGTDWVDRSDEQTYFS